MIKDIKIGSRLIGEGHKPFMIAEMSGNHGGKIGIAKKIIDFVAKSGADAIKLQTYTADTMTIDLDRGEFRVNDKNSIWFGKTLYELYQEAYTPWEWHEELFNYAEKLGLIPFSTPFDSSAVDFLENLNAACYKIASFENTDLDLIERVIKTGKPIIISTGMSEIGEISETVNFARAKGCQDLVLLKCTSSYPADPLDANLRTIPHLRELSGCHIGLSDHSLGIGVSVASIAFGVTVIEKHVTLDRNNGYVDSKFSMESEEFRQLVIETAVAHQALGNVKYGFTNSENQSSLHRRSLYIVEDIEVGSKISESNMRAIRPGLGLPIKFRSHFLEKTVRRKILRGTPVTWEILQ